jgi:hypothetical protein
MSTPIPTIAIPDQPDVLKPYTTCKFSNGLAAVSVDRLPGSGTRYRSVDTAQGVKRISMTDGYRVLLSFPLTDYFANLKVETSEPGRYADDKQASIQEMEYIIEKAIANCI